MRVLTATKEKVTVHLMLGTASQQMDQPMVVGIKGWEVSRLPPKGLPGIWGWTEALTPGHTEEETREPGGS